MNQLELNLNVKPMAIHEDVSVVDTEGRIKGRCRCGRCMGTGLFVVGIENDKPKLGGGICFRCAGKGWHDERDRKRNYWHDINYVPRN